MSTNGAISYSGELTGGGKNHLKTTNGSVKVRLEGDPSLNIDASFGHGKISSSLPGLSASGMVGQKLEATLGEGEAELVIRSSNGSMRID